MNPKIFSMYYKEAFVGEPLESLKLRAFFWVAFWSGACVHPPHVGNTNHIQLFSSLCFFSPPVIGYSWGTHAMLSLWGIWCYFDVLLTVVFLSLSFAGESFGIFHPFFWEEASESVRSIHHTVCSHQMSPTTAVQWHTRYSPYLRT